MFMRIQVRYLNKSKVVHLTSEEARMTGSKGTVRWKPVVGQFKYQQSSKYWTKKDGEFDDV